MWLPALRRYERFKIFFASGGPLRPRRPRYIDFVTKVIHWQCPRNQSSSVSEEYLWSILLADGIGNSVQCVSSVDGCIC